MISDKIQELEQKSAMRKVNPRPDQFISQIFLVPKKDGSQRPVVTLKPLNHLMARRKFKMDSARTLKDLVRRNDWLVSIDLKDAYLSVPLEEGDRKYLRFTWEERVYEFQCLPFGLSSAPRVFTELLKPVMALIRQRGLRSMIFRYAADGRIKLERQSQEVLALLRLLGFRINWGKFTTTPNTQTGVSGPHNRHSSHDTNLTRRKGAEDPEGMPVDSSQGYGVSEGLVETDWNDVGDNTGGLASSTTLQRAPGLEDTNTEENTVLPDYGVSERGIEGRAGVVDRNAQPVERPPNSPTDPGP